jgi:hypothetical protein
VLWERWGATQTEIARWKRLASEQAARDAVSLRIPTAAEQAQEQAEPGTTGGPPA